MNFFLRVVCTVSLTMLSIVPAEAMICSTNPNTAIPDGSGSASPGAVASVTIEVPAAYSNAITDLDFLLQINHSYVGDIIATLQSPAGTTVTLVNRPGVPASTFGCSGNNIDVTLDDEAGSLVENQCAGAVPTISGTHRPAGTLSSFDGQTPAGTWTLRVTDNAGQDTGTIIPSGVCLDLTTVPVALSSFETKVRGQKLISKWQTSSEAFNLGFDLWGEIDNEWVQLNSRLIASQEFDSTEPQNYRKRVSINELDGELTAVGISSISSSGQEEFFGPFELGERYGEETVPRRIDWAAQRARYDAAMSNAGYSKINGRWLRITKQRAARASRLNQRFPSLMMEVTKPGIYRVSYESLFQAGFDLAGMPVKLMAIQHNGRPVPRLVNTPNGRARFGPDSDVVFYVTELDSEAARYNDHSRYTLALEPAKVLAAPVIASSNITGDDATQTHLESIRIGEPNSYSFILPGDQPWFDSPVQAYRQIGTKVIPFELPDYAIIDQGAVFELDLLGGIDFPRRDTNGDGELEPHHHFRVYLNRDEFPAPIYEGFGNGFDPIAVSFSNTEQLRAGHNTIEFELIPDNGLNLDAAYFIGATIRYHAPNTAGSTGQHYQFKHNDKPVKISGVPSQQFALFRTDEHGNFAKLKPGQDNADTMTVELMSSAELQTTPSLWVMSSSDYLSPRTIFQPEPVDQDALNLADIDYVVIADPSLIGDTLSRFVDAQIEMGRRTKVVSSHAIFNRYTSGLPEPKAIAQYLKAQSYISPYQYVLLVGGHTYNYRGYNTNAQTQPMNLIPSFYRAGEGMVRQIPTAVPFVDFDADGAPDRAIGRWPVRDLAQLNNVVTKTLNWHAEGSHKSSQSALSIASAKEQFNQFTGSSDRVINALGNTINPWAKISRVYMDDINIDDNVPAGNKINEARNRLVDAINQGTALTVFNGHGSPTSWGNQSLMTSNVAQRLTNTETPTMMIPLACYTTYYETPSVQSLAELLLTDSPAGAVALVSPALLSRPLDNENFAKRLLQEMTSNGEDLGSAVLITKRATHANGGRHQSVVYNWTTLADPTLSFGLPKVSLPPVVDQPKTQ
ncbi:C25 family cysteine peptidase [Arenicella xantha]|uniref:Proprotein convertase P-domain-containing protein n=1 Tax=Arenicella xantha TaxID=644221 RepID=A0A395JFG8_9GAMM|nr:C25 family cysteine peptidase [Arenicella xantha]RBP48489.1 proprotein convertase P-domain-containing protein [Arenicella xantha]